MIPSSGMKSVSRSVGAAGDAVERLLGTLMLTVLLTTPACGGNDESADEHSTGLGGSGNPAGGSGGTNDTGGGGHQPADLGRASCDGLITDTDPHAMSALARPQRAEAATDPEFSTRVVRVTDVASETGGEVIKPLYSTIQAWNADESLLLLYEVGGGHRLYDGRSYDFVRALRIDPPDLEQVYWHPHDPDILFFARGNDLMQYSVSEDNATAVHRFEGCGSVSGGADPMYISWDGPAFGWLCERTSEAFVYHLDTDTESQRVAASDLGPQVAPSGDMVFLAGDVYDGSMTLVRSLDLDNPYDHASLGRLADGHDTFNTVAFDPGPGGSAVGTLVTFDLTTGQDTVVIGPQTGYPYPPSGTHISAVAHHAPGWVAVSVVGAVDGQDVLDNELLLADTNTGGVCRIAHHRSHGKEGPQGYWAEPHASISPSGSRVVFGSDWGGGDTVDTYVVELPSYAR